MARRLLKTFPVMIEVGQIVGNYRVTAKLGEGGMGVVYLVEHPVIGRRGALKAILPAFSRDADVVSRFTNEARVISRIGHEHIVDVTDFGRTDEGDFYFIMEFLRGESLSERIAREAPLSPPRAAAIAAQIADALAASHAHGVFHLDLKPENVFLEPRARTRDFVKVLDFGLAKLAHTDAAAGASELVMGTPHYMAPEQCEGLPTVDARADVYALGVMLFEMLTGRVPFAGDTAAEILQKHVTARPPAARGIVPILPDAMDRIVQTALAKDPAGRFPSMADFRAALLRPETVSPARGGSIGERLDRSRSALATWPQIGSDAIGPDSGRETSERTTLRGSVGAVEADPALDLVPARSWAPSKVGLALGGLVALATIIGLGARRPATGWVVASAGRAVSAETTPATPSELAPELASPSDAASRRVPAEARRAAASRGAARGWASTIARGPRRVMKTRAPLPSPPPDPDGDAVMEPFTR